MRETLNEVNIKHTRITLYHPQSNGCIARFNKSINSLLVKRLNDHVNTWDIHLNQALAAIRFNVSTSKNFSPFAIMFGRDPTLPIDNLLKPRRKCLGQEHHLIALEKSHESFMLVHRNLRKAKKRQAHYANQGAKDIDYKVGDPVFLKINTQKSTVQQVPPILQNH